MFEFFCPIVAYAGMNIKTIIRKTICLKKGIIIDAHSPRGAGNF